MSRHRCVATNFVAIVLFQTATVWPFRRTCLGTYGTVSSAVEAAINWTFGSIFTRVPSTNRRSISAPWRAFRFLVSPIQLARQPISRRSFRQKTGRVSRRNSQKTSLEAEYQKIIDKQKGVLSQLETSIQNRLRRWANPAASVALKWYYDPNKSLVVNEPAARISIGEDNFVGEIARLGHGMQRAFIVTMLQELAAGDQEVGPTLLLGPRRTRNASWTAQRGSGRIMVKSTVDSGPD